MSRCPPDLPSLKNPEWLTNLIAAFPGRFDLHAKFAVQYAQQVETERQARLATLGEATAAVRARIAAEALRHNGSDMWKITGQRFFDGPMGKEVYGPGHNKCNLFVYEMLVGAGARVELEVRENKVGELFGYPPLAGQWADPNVCIPGFEVLKVPPDTPQPGDVAAIKNVSWDASGHVGIVASPNTTVSGRADGVVHNDWGFRAENKGEVVFRRYVGWPEPGGSSPEPGTKTSGVAHDTVPPAPVKPREPNRCSSPVPGKKR